MTREPNTSAEVPNVLTNGSTADSTTEKSEPDHMALLTFSAADETSASRVVATYSQFLQDHNVAAKPELLHDIAFTLNARRTSFTWRTFAVLHQSTVTRLGELVAKPVKAGPDQGLGFVFTGQGALWYAMGRELLSTSIFMDSIVSSQTYLHETGCPWVLLGQYRGRRNRNTADSVYRRVDER